MELIPCASSQPVFAAGVVNSPHVLFQESRPPQLTYLLVDVSLTASPYYEELPKHTHS